MKFVAKTVFIDKSTKSVHFLMNNAAKSIGGNAIDTPMSEFITMMQTNLYGTIQTCQLFIPQMKELGEPGIIVNTGSKQGISMPPGNLTYNITKAALKTYTEGLEHELMMDRMNNCGKLKASLLIPGWVNTSIKVKEMRDRAALSKIKKFNYDRMKKIAACEENPADGAWMPKEVIDFMLQKLDDGSFYIICPDNEIDALADKARMTWAMQDIMEDRPPMSRWHPEWKGEFDKFLQTQKCFD
jgi:short-subunit dehydrogenase